MIMKGSTSCRRFYWLQANFSDGHEAAASQAPTNGCSRPKLLVQNGAGKLPVEVVGNEGYVGRCSDGRLYDCLTSADQR